MADSGTTGSTNTQTSTTSVNSNTQAPKNYDGKVQAQSQPGQLNKQPSQDKSSAEKAVETPKKYTLKGLKIRGEEQDLELDEDTLKRRVQQGMGADLAYKEAKQYREDADRKYAEYTKWQQGQEEFKQRLHRDPIAAALEMGADPALIRQATEDFLLKKINEDAMSPEAKRAIQLEQQLADKDKKLKDHETRTREQQLTVEADRFRADYQKQIIEAAAGTGLAKTALNISRIAQHMRIAQQRGIQPDPRRAAALVHEENSSNVQAMVGDFATKINSAFTSKDNDSLLSLGSQLEALLGPDLLKAIQRYGIVKYRSKTPQLPLPVLDTQKARNDKTPEQVSRESILEDRKKRAQDMQRKWELERKGAVST